LDEIYIRDRRQTAAFKECRLAENRKPSSVHKGMVFGVEKGKGGGLIDLLTGGLFT